MVHLHKLAAGLGKPQSGSSYFKKRKGFDQIVGHGKESFEAVRYLPFICEFLPTVRCLTSTGSCQPSGSRQWTLSLLIARKQVEAWQLQDV